MIVLLCVVPTMCGLPERAWSAEQIDRRDQARRAFLSSPQSIYGHYCAHCHAEDGTGKGRLWATELAPEPVDLTALTLDRDYLIGAIRDGTAARGKSNLCPPWGRTISPEDIQRLAEYILSMRGPSPASESILNASIQDVVEPFPWRLVIVIIVELVVLVWMFSNRKRRFAA